MLFFSILPLAAASIAVSVSLPASAVLVFIIAIAALDCVAELQPHNVVAMKAVTLQGVDDHGGLADILKVSESEVNLVTFPSNARDETKLAESLKRPKDMSNFSFGAVSWQTFDINCASGLGSGRDKTAHVIS